MIQYRYAINERDELVDINNLSKDQSDKFFAVDTREELIPKLGSIRQKHFAHKVNSGNPGSKETYLHALGKKVFLDIYRNCLEKDIPYYLKYKSNNRCNRLEGEYGKVCYKEEVKLTNLCRNLNQIKLEKGDNEFIPDLLLFHPLNEKKIYIEVAVTHTSSVEKINSGIPIIEFLIKSEQDIEVISKFGEQGFYREEQVRLYNFKSEFNQNCISPNCSQDFHCFTVDTVGKSRLKTCKEHEVASLLSDAAYSIVKPKLSIIEDGQQEAFFYRSYVKKAYNENAKIKNCFICRYHSQNDLNAGGHPIFCKHLKVACNSNQASACGAFRVDKKYTT